MPSSNKIIIDIYDDDDNNDNKYNYYKNGDISIKCKNKNNFKSAQDSRRVGLLLVMNTTEADN